VSRPPDVPFGGLDTLGRPRGSTTESPASGDDRAPEDDALR
jgi:hypothetical protein